MRSSVTFIVFALNEESRIAATVDTLNKAVADNYLSNYQIVLVNDGSIDRTGETMNMLAASDDRIVVHHNVKNLGQGGAYKAGLKLATCDYVMAIAGDNAASVNSIRSTISGVGDADVILPYPANPGSRVFIRRFGSSAFTALINFLFRLRVPYYNGAVFRTKLVQNLPVRSNGYAFFAEMVVKTLSKGATHINVPVIYPESLTSHSSALKTKNLYYVLRDVVILYVLR